MSKKDKKNNKNNYDTPQKKTVSKVTTKEDARAQQDQQDQQQPSTLIARMRALGQPTPFIAPPKNENEQEALTQKAQPSVMSNSDLDSEVAPARMSDQEPLTSSQKQEDEGEVKDEGANQNPGKDQPPSAKATPNEQQQDEPTQQQEQPLPPLMSQETLLVTIRKEALEEEMKGEMSEERREEAERELEQLDLELQELKAQDAAEDQRQADTDSEQLQVQVPARPLPPLVTSPQKHALGNATPQSKHKMLEELAQEQSLEINLSFNLDDEEVLPQRPEPGPFQSHQPQTQGAEDLQALEAPKESVQPPQQQAVLNSEQPSTPTLNPEPRNSLLTPLQAPPTHQRVESDIEVTPAIDVLPTLEAPEESVQSMQQQAVLNSEQPSTPTFNPEPRNSFLTPLQAPRQHQQAAQNTDSTQNSESIIITNPIINTGQAITNYQIFNIYPHINTIPTTTSTPIIISDDGDELITYDNEVANIKLTQDIQTTQDDGYIPNIKATPNNVDLAGAEHTPTLTWDPEPSTPLFTPQQGPQGQPVASHFSSASAPTLQETESPEPNPDLESTGASAPLARLNTQQQESQETSNSESESEPESANVFQPLETPPLLIPEPAAGSYLSPNVLTGAAALALAAYWCYMNQDEVCALLMGYDSACSSGWSWGGGL